MNKFNTNDFEKEKKYITPEIYIVDNFLPIDFIDDLQTKLFSSLWYIHNSDPEKYPDSFFWATMIGSDNYAEEINYLSEKLNNRNIIRIYANGQSSTQHGDFHMDDGDRTYLIGMSKEWDMDSGGATEFVIDEANHITTSIYPLYNRLISFPSNVMHRALPNISLNKFRITLAIKTADKENNNPKKNSAIEFIS
jgi:hypothetical protein